MVVKTWINNREYEKHIATDDLLIDFLRKLGYKSVKRGCDTANCGLCTVYVDNKPVLSCSTLAARVDGKQVTTLEGIESRAKEFGEFMADEGAEQCGYCSPGFIMSVLAMCDELHDPTDEEIKEYLSGNLCRCTGYMGQLRAIKKFLAFKQNQKEVQS